MGSILIIPIVLYVIFIVGAAILFIKWKNAKKGKR